MGQALQEDVVTAVNQESEDHLRNRIVAWERVTGRAELGQRGIEEGATVDRAIERSWWKRKTAAGMAGASLFAGLLGYFVFFGESSRKLNVQKERITVSTVARGPFQEFIPVRGTVLPIRTVFLDALVGGRVDNVFIDEGSMVDKGDMILKLSNPKLELDVMNQEASLYDQINSQQNTLINLEQGAIKLEEQLIEIEHNIQQEKRTYEKNSKLWDIRAIARHDFEQSRSDYEFWLSRRDFVAKKARRDSVYRVAQVRRINASIGKLEANLGALRRNLDALVLSAPISGQLTSLDAEIGARKSEGQRFGQVDVLEGFKVRTGIDEFYIHRITSGQRGTCKVAGEGYDLIIRKVYPEVSEGKFEVDLEFAAEVPTEIRRGQTLQIRLELGDLEEALLLARGGFYQATGGNWVFVVDPSGEVATRREIRIGRQSPEFFEVLDGLEPGEQVITSSYDHYQEMEKLILQD